MSTPETQPNGKLYWMAAAAYAAVVAIQLGGFWTVLHFALIILAARQGFVILTNLYTMARNTELMEQLTRNRQDKKLLGTLALSAVLYTIAIPLGNPLPAYLATAAVWIGTMVVVGTRTTASPQQSTSKKETQGENNAA